MRTVMPAAHFPAGNSLLKVVLFLGFVIFTFLSSLHYYHSANDNREASILLSQISKITATASRLNDLPITTTSIASALPEEAMVTPWGSSISVEEDGLGAYTLKIPLMPARVCKLLKKEVRDNPRVMADATHCPHSGSVTFLYTVA